MVNLKIRPHHALCAQFFVGKGYSDDFVKHMRAVLTALGQSGASVVLTDECDCICSHCPNNAGGKCQTEEKVKMIDKRAIEALGLKFGDTVKWQAVCKTAEDSIIASGKLEEVCGDCEWIDTCKNILKVKY